GWRNAQLVRQLSGSACDEGRTWGSRNGSIWVTKGTCHRMGCRHESAVPGPPGRDPEPGTITTLALPSAPAAAQSGVIRCESQNNRERVCNTGWRNAQLVRQLSGSACDEGRTWGSRNGSIWVT
ncbi:hypothetical protein C7E12_18185, partial [Stenotrophomonas maltophilia]